MEGGPIRGDLALLEGCGPLLQGVQGAANLRQEVFECVRARGQMARAQIAKALQISPGTVTTLTADLIAQGLLREVDAGARDGLRDGGRGRPRVALEVVPEAGCVIGIKLGLSTHSAVLVDFAGHVLADAVRPSLEARRSVAQLIDEIDALIRAVLEQGSMSLADINGVGIGLPGIIDHNSGRIAWSSLLQARDVYLQPAFGARFDVPLAIDNDANMLTLAELWFGEGRARRDFAVVTIETGVGMGLVLNNQIYRGAHGMGLELGHTKVQLDGALCQCGQRGCLEAYIADYALAREAATALGRAPQRATRPEEVLSALFEEAKAGHAAAETIFRRAGRFLSLGLSNVVQLFDPELIILSGARMRYDYFYADRVLNEARGMTLNGGREMCDVVINAWGDLVWARGASALALSLATQRLLSLEARAS